MEAGLFRPMMLLAALLAVPVFYLAWRKEERLPKVVTASRAVLLLLIVFAAAQPFVQTSKSFLQQPEVTVLDDRSSSAELMEKPELEFEDLWKTERVVASGNASDLRTGMLRNLEEDSSYLAVTDFQSTGGPIDDISEEFNERNATLNALRPDQRYDAAVSIEGPRRTVPGASNTFRIEVSSTAEIPEPAVTVDGREAVLTKTGNGTWELRRTFDSRGQHTVTANISSGGEYSINDRFYHAVEVVEKPEILVVGSEGVLGEQLSEFYEIDYVNTLPGNLSPYYAVIATEEVSSPETLTPYVAEGNGFVYTGPLEDTELPGVLPVREDDEGGQTEATKTVLTIDNSQAFGAEEGARRTGQKIAAAVVDGLETNNRVGVVYYNGTVDPGPVAVPETGIVRNPVPLTQNRRNLKRGVAGLNPGGQAFHFAGLETASEITNGTGNIILVTDGALVTGRESTAFRDTLGFEDQQNSFGIAESLEERLIVVGVSPLGSTSTDPQGEEFLRELASRAGGQYYDAKRVLNSGQVINLLGGGGAGTSASAVSIVFDGHYITEGLELEASVTELRQAATKRGSTELARVSSGNPFLTVWTYGLGRSAAFTADDPQLSKTVSSDPLLVSRTVAWSVGDPKRKQDRWIRVPNGREPAEVEAEASYSAEGFERSTQDTYTRTVEPERLGFHNVSGRVFAYNYPEEYEKVGYSGEMEEVVRRTGGKVYSTSELDQVAEDVKSFEREEAVKRTSLSPFILAAALLLFLAEVAYRKVNGKK